MNALLEAHLRMLTMLPVRSVEGKKPKYDPGEYRGPGSAPRPIEIDGTRYESVSAAFKSRHCSPRTIYRFLDSGRAKYV